MASCFGCSSRVLRRLGCAAAYSAFAVCIAYGQNAAAPYLDPRLSPETRAHDLVQRMTLEEKAQQSLNQAPGIQRLGVPAYDYWSEGLHGIARSGYATLFPQAIGLAATWDAPLMQQVGTVVSTEARAKYNEAVRHDVRSIYYGLTIWSPNINIFRDPRWGRGQETYGEDPFLAGTLGVAFIRGLQGPDPDHPRVVATPKHFAVHSGPESDRHRFNVEPSAHDLWDTYLPQFRMAIVDAKANSIMCAYNAVNGQPACASELLLNSVLRGNWNFKGFVTSDCGAIDDFFEKNAHHYSIDKEHAAALGVKMGTDTNCGGTYKVLPAAVHHGLLTEAELDRTVERLFTARMRLGLFDVPSSQPYAQIPFSANRSTEHLQLSRKAAEESMVLLKNDGILPLKAARYKTIAVIGPNAASLASLEGNYNAVPREPVLPLDGIKAAFRNARILYSQGAPYGNGAASTVPRTMLRPSAESQEEGLQAEYFTGVPGDMASSFHGRPVVTRIDHEIDFDWNSAAPVKGLSQDAFAVRWTGVIVPPRAGDFEFNMRLAHCYPCGDREHFTIRIDGRDANAFSTKGGEGRESTTPRFHVQFADTRPHAIVVEYTHHAPLFGGGITMEWVPPAGLLQVEAVNIARQSDLVIAMVGLSPELEGEEMKVQVEGFGGGDRTDISLPASQLQMLQDVAATGKPIVVVLLNGSALAVNWAQEHANAILEAWYPGEFGGDAIAATLIGSNKPSGRLPVTFYRSTADLPAFTDYSMKNRTYRYFSGTPLYGFGYGLSYTRFAYSKLKLSRATLEAGGPLTAEAEVRNVGNVAGEEVVQLYLVPPAEGNSGLSPKRQLEDFQRISLKPGERRIVRFTLQPRQLSEVDSDGVRSVQPGNYMIAIGGAQPGDALAPSRPVTAPLTIKGSAAIPR